MILRIEYIDGKVEDIECDSFAYGGVGEHFLTVTIKRPDRLHEVQRIPLAHIRKFYEVFHKND